MEGDSAGKGPGPIRSPLQMFQPPRHVHIEHHEHERKGSFVDMLAVLALVALGGAGLWAFDASPPGSLADALASWGMLAYLCAGALAIVENSRAAELKEARKEAAEVINRVVKDYTNI